jgi:HlyD family secretion protein
MKVSKMLKISRHHFIVVAALTAVGGSALWGVRAQAADPARPATAKPALTVTLAKPQSVNLPLVLAANGNVAAWQDAIIGAEVGGLRLAEVRAQVGDVVRRGQVLAVFAQEQVQADLAHAQAAVMEAAAGAADAKANADRARSLQGTGALSAQQMAQFLTAEQSGAARLEMAKAQLAHQNIRLKNTQVTAPDDGFISARSATVGAVVGTGAELFRLIRQGRLEWRAEVTASEVGRIRKGAKVRVVAASGVQTRSVMVYVDIAARAGVKAGMFAKGEFELGASQALTVPQAAVVMRDGFSYVMVASKPAQADASTVRLSQIKVQTGRRSGAQVEILSGLAADAQVVTSGVAFLTEGDLVKVVAP